jgi:CDP-diacylglycerol--serine O-phosphatidyltransferase
MLKSLPNLITLGNLTCGLLAIVAVFEGEPLLAFVLMLIASVLDFFDGFAARLLGVAGELGKQLDSLADLVSFGIVPGLIWRHYMLFYGFCPSTGFCINQYVWLAIPLAAAYRLAVFNISEDQTTTFKGIPTPITGLALASWAWVNESNWVPSWSITGVEIFQNFYVYLYMPILAAYFMISDHPMLSMKFNNTDGHNIKRFVLIGLMVFFTIGLFESYGIILFYFSYILISLITLKDTPQSS